MKKILCLLLAMTMLFAVACGGDQGGNEPADDSSAASIGEGQNNSGTNSQTQQTIVVPDIKGMSAAEAEKALKDVGFDVKVREKNYDDIPKGEVAEIDLTVGESYDYGTTCFLFVSGGKTAAAKALEYDQSDLVEIRTKRTQGENSDYQPINYEFVKAVWLSQFDMQDVYSNGSMQRTEAEFTEKVKLIFKGLKDIGFNTLFVQLRPNGDSMYPSEYYCPSRYVVGMYGLDFAYDPLEIMIEEAHALGLSIHGWINPLRCMDPSAINLINVSYGLRQFEREHMNDYVIKFDGLLYLNPGREEVRQLIINGAAEIVRYYDIDGIHIDDYFYPSGMGFDHDKESFLAQTTFTDQTYFRRDSLNRLVSGIYSAVKAENPKVLFGVSPAGQPSAVRGAYADIDTWLSTEGYLDYIMPQLYWGLEHSSGAFDKLYINWNNLIKIDSIRFIPGMTLSNAAGGTTNEWIRNKDVLKRCIEFASDFENFHGFSLFSSANVVGHSNGVRVPSTQEEIDNLFDFVSDRKDTPLGN